MEAFSKQHKAKVAIILLRDRRHFIYLLQKLFSDYMEFTTYSFEEGICTYINCDLALVPSNTVLERVRRYLLPGTPVIVIRRTLSRFGWEVLQKIPAQEKVLVVNTYHEMSLQLISTIYELGMYRLKLIPFDNDHPEKIDLSDIHYAITSNERGYIPKEIEHVCEIGTRPLDLTTLLDILSKLNLVNDKTMAILRENEADIMPLSAGFVNIFNHFQQRQQDLATLLELTGDGILVCDLQGYVTNYNRPASEIFKSKNVILANCPLSQLIGKEAAAALLAEMTKHKIIYLSGQPYEIIWRRNEQGGMLSLRKTSRTDMDKMDHAAPQRGLRAKYNFRDICGESRLLQHAVRLTARAAKTDSDILIEGESGTGKELFVQSIHNASARRRGPFVAFNCATLSSSLLESELFGYEDGAFTGARAHGRKGLFEMANHGTIFLDEISEIPMTMQAKLLRVIQEREFIRVGGTTPIPVDLRVIAATNQNLFELVKEKKFRMDLYFRLNVFDLRLPPLRERTGDIPILVRQFLAEHGIQTDMPQETMHYLQAYTWPGNIRELKNCVEYMWYLGEGYAPENLPIHIRQYFAKNQDEIPYSVPVEANNSADTALDETDHAILQAASDANGTSRRKILKILSDNGQSLSESTVRMRLTKLAAFGMVTVERGRRGTHLTPRGRKHLDEWH